MSSIPATNAGIISEVLWFKWADDLDVSETEEAIAKALENYPEIDGFLDKMRRWYYDSGPGEHPPSWRDFREFTVRDRLTDQEEFEPLLEDIVENMQEIHDDFEYDPEVAETGLLEMFGVN